MFQSWKLSAVIALAGVMASPVFAAEPVKPKGLGDPGQLTALRVEPNLGDQGVTVRGRDARQQLFVTGVYSSGQFRDHTRKVSFASDPAGIVQIDPTGLL
ncbi:MAG: S-layer protein, partial [Planctomycetota bacterium]|nr:S-layer protein [Planctomycetota bacterium]